MSCCNECFEEGVSQLSYGGCRNKNCLCHHPVNRPTTSPEKNWEKEWEKFSEKGRKTAENYHKLPAWTKKNNEIKAFIHATLDNQKKSIIEAIKSVKMADWTFPDQKAVHDAAIRRAITKITNL